MTTVEDLIFDEICEDAFPLLEEWNTDDDVTGQDMVVYLVQDLNITKPMSQRVLDAWVIQKETA